MNVLEYIKGEPDAAVFGAWDLVTANAMEGKMDLLIRKYRQGTYKR